MPACTTCPSTRAKHINISSLIALSHMPCVHRELEQDSVALRERRARFLRRRQPIFRAHAGLYHSNPSLTAHNHSCACQEHQHQRHERRTAAGALRRRHAACTNSTHNTLQRITQPALALRLQEKFDRVAEGGPTTRLGVQATPEYTIQILTSLALKCGPRTSISCIEVAAQFVHCHATELTLLHSNPSQTTPTLQSR